VLDQLGDTELGEQVLQLLRAEIDHGNEKVIAILAKSAQTRAGEVGKTVQKEWARAQKEVAKPAPAKKGAKSGDNGHARIRRVNPVVMAAVFEQGLLLRLIVLHGAAERAQAPHRSSRRGIGRARSGWPSIAALRRIVASQDAKGTEQADRDVDRARERRRSRGRAVGGRHAARRAPSRSACAKPFAALAKSKNTAAQKLAMERMPAGGGRERGQGRWSEGRSGGDDPTARDAAARGPGQGARGGAAAGRARWWPRPNPDIARRYAGALRAHRGHVSSQANRRAGRAGARASRSPRPRKADADTILLERVLVETLADVAPARHVEILFDHAKKLRKTGKPDRGVAALKPLLRTHADLDAAIDDEAALRDGGARPRGARPGNPAPDRRRRAGDRAVRSARPARLPGRAQAREREKDVGDEEVYALGFRLLESKLGDEEELGAELMQGSSRSARARSSPSRRATSSSSPAVSTNSPACGQDVQDGREWADSLWTACQYSPPCSLILSIIRSR